MKSKFSLVNLNNQHQQVPAQYSLKNCTSNLKVSSATENAFELPSLSDYRNKLAANPPKALTDHQYMVQSMRSFSVLNCNEETQERQKAESLTETIELQPFRMQRSKSLSILEGDELNAAFQEIVSTHVSQITRTMKNKNQLELFNSLLLKVQKLEHAPENDAIPRIFADADRHSFESVKKQRIKIIEEMIAQLQLIESFDSMQLADAVALKTQQKNEQYRELADKYRKANRDEDDRAELEGRIALSIRQVAEKGLQMQDYYRQLSQSPGPSLFQKEKSVNKMFDENHAQQQITKLKFQEKGQQQLLKSAKAGDKAAGLFLK